MTKKHPFTFNFNRAFALNGTNTGEDGTTEFWLVCGARVTIPTANVRRVKVRQLYDSSVKVVDLGPPEQGTRHAVFGAG